MLIEEYNSQVSTTANEVSICELTNLSNFTPEVPHIFTDNALYYPKVTHNVDFKVMRMSEYEFVGPVAKWENAIYVKDADSAIYWDDPQGIYKGCIDNKLMAACASFQKGPNIGWIGYYMVQPEFRKKGYGVAIFNEVLELDKARGVNHHTFNCIEPLMPMYERIDFKNFSYDTIFRAMITPASAEGLFPVATFDQSWLEKINDYDRLIHHTWDRKNSLVRWITKERTKMLVALSAEKQVVGFVVISDFRYPTGDDIDNHQRLAPLYADSPAIAQQLIAAALKICDCSSVFVDADGNNPEAINVINSFDLFTPQLRLARMSRPEPIDYYQASCVYSHTHYGSGI